MCSDNEKDPIVEKFGRLSPAVLLSQLGDKVKRRTLFLDEVYQNYLHGWSGIYLNRRLLRVAVESYYCDVYRLKFFREVNWIDAHKRAAFTMKWLAQIHPVQAHSGAHLDISALMANAYFAFVAGFSILDVELDAELMQNNDDLEWWSGYCANFIYGLHYHSISVDQLSSELFLLEKMNRLIIRNS